MLIALTLSDNDTSLAIKMRNKKMQAIRRRVLFLCGVISVTFGIIGIFLPLLPATPFLILAAFCFARSSKKAHFWLLTNRWCGEYIKNYREKKGISLKHKIFSLTLLWIAIGYSTLFATENFLLRLVLVIIAVGVTVHILSMPTYRKKCANNSALLK